MPDSRVILLGPGACVAAGAVETPAEIRRIVKQETPDNEALYCRLQSAPSHSFPYSGSFTESCIVSWLQGAKGNIILCVRWP